MRPLSSALAAEQRNSIRTPLVKLEVASYGHPSAVAAADLKWSDFYWERLTHSTDATPLGLNHAVAIPADGSVCRVRAYSSKVYYQRVTSPSVDDDWEAAWTNLGSIAANSKVAIAALGTNVVLFTDNGTNLYRRQSSDSGATWGAWVSMTNARPGERGMAAAFKANGDLACVHASDVNDPTSLYIQIRTGSTWSTGLGQISGDFEISALALYHDGDWNLLALILDGSAIRLARGIYGDGHDYSAGTWSGWEFINSYKAKVTFTGQTALRTWRTQGRKKSQPTYYERVSSVSEMQAADTLGVDDPFITYHASLGAVLIFARSNSPWFYRLRAGTAFKDMDWNKAWPLDTLATQGLALACDGTCLYATAPNQVWRTALPGTWAPPAAGAGAGTDYAVTAADILSVKETVTPHALSKLEIVLDNSAGAYNSLGGGAASAAGKLKLGAQVTLSIGYHTDADLLSVANKYYVEGIGYSRLPGRACLHINCIDAWGLLEKYAFNQPAFWNEASDDLTVYELCRLVIQAIGGALDYRSRSSAITGTYPRFEVRTGENGAVVLRNLLALVPDVIFFAGLTGYIVYPQAADSQTYYLTFP